MPAHAVDLLVGSYGDIRNARVVVLGAAYRGGVKETAFSGVFALADALAAEGARVMVHDPLYSDAELRAIGMTPFHFGDEVDGAIIHTDHEEYRQLSPADLSGVRSVVDGRALLDVSQWTGVDIRTVGRGTPGEPARSSST
jgi:UDP-N-acetyl-D-mannosaminuronate dehydrogenase